MSKFTKEMVDSYAENLLIGLTAEENELVLKEFDKIDKDMDIVNSISNISNVKPMTFPLEDKKATLRKDEAKDGVPVELLLKNAGKKIGREVEVVKVVS